MSLLLAFSVSFHFKDGFSQHVHFSEIHLLFLGSKKPACRVLLVPVERRGELESCWGARGRKGVLEEEEADVHGFLIEFSGTSSSLSLLTGT